MFKNTGAILRGTLEELPHGKLALAARAMSYISALAGGLVALCAVLMISIGTMLYFVPTAWLIDYACTNCFSKVPPKNIVLLDQVLLGVTLKITEPWPIENRLDAKCPELQKKPRDQNLLKCTWTPHTLSRDEIAAKFKQDFTPYNLFKAFIPSLCLSCPIFLLAWGLMEASRCLNGLAFGRYFDASTLKHLYNFALSGLFCILLPLCMPIIYSIISILINLIHGLYWKMWPPEGSYSITSFSLWEMTVPIGGLKLFYGFMICLYAVTMTMVVTVMFKAAKIVKDHAEII